MKVLDLLVGEGDGEKKFPEKHTICFWVRGEKERKKTRFSRAEICVLLEVDWELETFFFFFLSRVKK